MSLALPPTPAGLQPSDEGLLNLPNLISATRLPLGMAFWFAVDRPLVAVAILLLAGFTDMLDGLVARQTHHTSRLGGVVDPIFDKVFVLIVVAAMVWYERIDLWQLLLLTIRDWLMVPMMIGASLLEPQVRARLTLRSNYFGKATTVIQFFALVAALAWPSFLTPLTVVATVSGLLCVASYGARGWREAFGAAAHST